MKFILGCLFSLTCVFSINAQQRELPPATEVQSELSSDDAVTIMAITHKTKDQPESNKLKTNVNLLDLEIEKGMGDFIARRGMFASLKSVPDKNLGILAVRYSIDDPRVAKYLVAAKKKGFRQASIILDFNTEMNAKLPEDQDSTTEFNEDWIIDGEAGQVLRDLLKGGIKHNDPQAGFFSQPLFNKKKIEIIPIMHQKCLYLVVFNDDGTPKQIFAYYGTGNWARNPRYNRSMLVADPVAAKFMYEHDQLMARGFAEGKSTKELKTPAPLRINYKDGGFQEIGYTDGKFNPNTRLANLLRASGADPKAIQIQEVILSHFVLTNSQVYEGLREALDAHHTAGKGFMVHGVLDDKFITVEGYGVSPGLIGYPVDRPLGPNVRRYPPRLWKYMDLFAYQRGRPGTVETDPDGAPTNRHVWHDKTTIVRTIENGKEWVYVFTGSFNNSNHVDNAEIQVMYKLPAETQLAKAFIESIRGVVQAEKGTDFMVPFSIGVFRNAIARFLDHSIFEFTAKECVQIMQKLQNDDFEGAKRLMLAILKRPSSLRKQPDRPAIEALMDEEFEFFKWYKKQPGYSELSPQKIVAISLAFEGDDSPKDIYGFLDDVFWRPGITPEEKNAKIREAWDIIDHSWSRRGKKIPYSYFIMTPKELEAAKAAEPARAASLLAEPAEAIAIEPKVLEGSGLADCSHAVTHLRSHVVMEPVY